ncbi:MAG: tetratricopeptide repeat protein [Kiritimatiellae bacterium]|nr:tetratricopeptide repeat protein [Kiritimatiellia bacterium]
MKLDELKKKLDLLISIGLGVLAFFVYALTVSHGLYPGESANLVAEYSGIAPLALPLHPVWAWFVKGLSGVGIFSLPLRLNLFSALCMAISASLIYWIVHTFIKNTISEEYSIDFRPRVATFAATISSIAFLFSAPIWQSAIRLQYQSFDILLALLCGVLLALYARQDEAQEQQNDHEPIKGRLWLLFLFAFVYGLGLCESVLFIPLTPLLVAALIGVLWKNHDLSLGRVVQILLVTVLVASFVFWKSAQSFWKANGEMLGLVNTMAVVKGVANTNLEILHSYFPRVSWLILLLTGFVPFAACLLASFRALNNERSWSNYLLHLTMTILVVLGLANAPISPWAVTRPMGRLPVASYTMLAMTAGYLVAYWYLMLKVKRPKRGSEITSITKKTGDWLGLLLAYPLAALVCLASLVNAVSCRGSYGAFADLCASEILDRLGDRTWFVTDGLLDPHLQVLAKERRQELNLICLQNDMDQPYWKSLAKLVAEKKAVPEKDLSRICHTLEGLGILPFLQDWLATDKEIENKVAFAGFPDLWYSGNLQPVPEYLFFGGVRSIRPLADKPLMEDYQAFWKKMELLLSARRVLEDPVDVLRFAIRTRMGFVANNLGFLMEDLALLLRKEKDPASQERAAVFDEQAYKVYCEVHDRIDPDNISALFNRCIMANRREDQFPVAAASVKKDVVTREVRDFITNLKSHKYPLYSLSRIYGYIRSPELFAKLGAGWALSGQTGAAQQGLANAYRLMPKTENKSGIGLLAANIFAVSAKQEDRDKAEAFYKGVLENDPKDKNALLGLARLAMQKGAVEQASSWLDKISKEPATQGTLGIEWATVYLMNGDLEKARLSLQEATDLQPRNLKAWGMLAVVQIQQGEIEDVEKVTLPRMETIAGSDKNYFIQLTRAQLALKRCEKLELTDERGKVFRREARSGFIRALDLSEEKNLLLQDKILELDMELNDQDDAELHARQILRMNRDHAKANYIMGSIRLQRGDYGEAEDFLRRSVATKPTPEALNDLAETLQRIQRYADAEKFARQAVEMNPKLYVAWETLGAIQLAQGKNLDEAEENVRKAIQLYGGDLRMQITLARVLLKKGEIEQARVLLREVEKKQGELPDFDKQELQKIQKEASSAKVR